jgi:hypothetical protein
MAGQVGHDQPDAGRQRLGQPPKQPSFAMNP